MNPIGERVLWFVLGLLAGAMLGWLLARPRRARAPASIPVEPATPQPHPAAADAEAATEAGAVIASARLIDVGAARAAGFNMKHADDLTVIEGIGPRIHDLLRANGIDGFAQVARLHPDDLLDLLERGGPNFRLADPSTWPQQAALAAENRWKELKELQRQLIGLESGQRP
ncbi:MAG: hypothetical protein GXC76_07730 [Rhodanobacteraceae bacterium]|jgi:predicted flap endonuclease-1-like 5' DNA nuclease|nr:hypothetical protein [Rhodanobacteraceae bacterium]